MKFLFSSSSPCWVIIELIMVTILALNAWLIFIFIQPSFQNFAVIDYPSFLEKAVHTPSLPSWNNIVHYLASEFKEDGTTYVYDWNLDTGKTNPTGGNTSIPTSWVQSSTTDSETMIHFLRNYKENVEFKRFYIDRIYDKWGESRHTFFNTSVKQGYHTSAILDSVIYFVGMHPENSSSYCLSSFNFYKEESIHYTGPPPPVDFSKDVMLNSNGDKDLFLIEGMEANSRIFRFRQEDSTSKNLVLYMLNVTLPTDVTSNGFHMGQFMVFTDRNQNLVLLDVKHQTATIEPVDKVQTQLRAWYEPPGDRYVLKIRETLTSGLYNPSRKIIYIFTTSVNAEVGVGSLIYAIRVPEYLTTPVKDMAIETVNAAVGEDVSIFCRIRGSPEEIIWSKNGTGVPGNGITLTLTVVKKHDSGLYRCDPKKYKVDAFSFTQLNVYNRTNMDNGLKTKTVALRENLDLECIPEHDAPIVDITWYRHANKVHNGTSSTLTIMDAKPSDAGNYKCKVKTSVDSVIGNFFVQVTNTSSDAGERASPTRPDITIILVLSAAFLLIACCLSIYYIQKYKKIVYLTKQEMRQFKIGLNKSGLEVGLGEFTDRHPYNPAYELSLSDIIEINKNKELGHGEFGFVYEGVVKLNNKQEKVAFKTVKAVGSEEGRKQLKCLLSELKVMLHVERHPFIITLIGAYTRELEKGVAHIILEFCENGNLETYLRKSWHESSVEQKYENVLTGITPTVTKSMQSAWSMQISQGMHHLAMKKILHSDLATRNILLSKEGTIRISDFGLARKLENDNYIKTGWEPLPWRSMAVEALEFKMFSVGSDLWAYGVTIWEIYSMGKVPYVGQVYTPEFIQKLKSGERLPKPEFASEEIYLKMKQCWSLDASLRPNFQAIESFFRQVHYQDSNITYM